MKLAVFGANTIGLTAAATFAIKGYEVSCSDDDHTLIRTLKNGTVPVHEPGMLDLFYEAEHTGKLCFTTNKLPAASEADFLLFTEVITTDETQTPDLTNLYRFIRQIAVNIHSHKTFIIKSTVPPGTCAQIENILMEQGLTREEFEVVHNPDFCRRGTTVKDFMNPTEIIIGASSLRGCRIMESFYHPITSSFQFMDFASAELMKYACHTYTAMNISCLNMMAGMAEIYGADVEVIRGALRADPRMVEQSLHPGSCFSENEISFDASTFRSIESKSLFGLKLNNMIEEIEQHQPELLIEKLKDFLGTLREAIVGVLGNSLNDHYPSPSNLVIKRLEEEGAEVKLFDPATNTQNSLNCTSLNETISNCDAILLLTELPHIQHIEWGNVVKRQRLPLLVDGHNLFTLEEARRIANEHDLIYCSIGRPNIYKGLGSISVQS